MSSLLIIDAHAIVHRAYHSIPRLTHNGQPVNAIYGFYSMILSSVDRLGPEFLVVCSDSPGPTFRQTEFVGYRAQRRIPDRDLISQLPLLDQTLRQAGLPLCTMGGYEADDLIASVTLRANKLKKINKVIIITGDKDMMQLVNTKVSLFMPVKGLSQTQLIGPKEVEDKLGVKPTQVIDLKALMGDLSDNYPGVAGIGPKGAVDLLNQYGSLDNIYAHLSDIPQITRTKLERGKENAYLSQKLATLIDNIPLEINLSESQWNPPRRQKLLELFQSFNFKSLASRLQKISPELSASISTRQGPKSKKSPSASNQGSLF